MGASVGIWGSHVRFTRPFYGPGTLCWGRFGRLDPGFRNWHPHLSFALRPGSKFFLSSQEVRKVRYERERRPAGRLPYVREILEAEQGSRRDTDVALVRDTVEAGDLPIGLEHAEGELLVACIYSAAEQHGEAAVTKST